MALESIALLTLQALEESMWVSESRFDPTYMDAVLHPDFTEVGRSGRLFTRDDVLSMPAVEIRVEIPLRGLEIVEIAPDVVLTRYTTVPLCRCRRLRFVSRSPCGVSRSLRLLLTWC